MENEKNVYFVDVAVFGTAFFSSNLESQIWFGDDLAWHARTETLDGIFILTKPDGSNSYSELENLLSILSGVGIRRIVVECDGFPAHQGS